jgi:hypothetical protein
MTAPRVTVTHEGAPSPAAIVAALEDEQKNGPDPTLVVRALLELKARRDAGREKEEGQVADTVQ